MMHAPRRLAVLVVVAVLLALGGYATPVAAAATVTAEGVALAPAASCSNASLDLTLTSGDIPREFGQSSVLDGTVTEKFEQESTALDNRTNSTFKGYPIGVSPKQSEGTIIGSYAYLGDTPPTAAGTAEFFVLYRCSADGSANEVLLTCWGDYGTCPRDARSANLPRLKGPGEATPGDKVTVTGGGCYDGAGTFEVRLPGTKAPVQEGSFKVSEGSLEFTFTMPDAPVGTQVDVVVTCGDPRAPTSDPAIVSVLATVVAPDPDPTPTPTPTPIPTPTPTPTPAAGATAVVAAPNFTG